MPEFSVKKGDLYQNQNGQIFKIHPQTRADQVIVNPSHDPDTTVLDMLGDIMQSLEELRDIDAFEFKGGVSSNSQLPAAADRKPGMTYRVTAAGTYAGKVCEVNDVIYCVAANGTNDDFMVVQANIDGAVTGPASSTQNNFAVFGGTNGKTIVDSGISKTKISTIETNVSNNATAVGSVNTALTTYKNATNPRLTTLETNVSNLQTAIGTTGASSLGSRLGEAESDITALQGDVSDLETSLGSLSSELGTYKTLNDGRVAAVAGDVTTLQDDYSAYKTSNNAAVASAASAASAAQTSITNYQNATNPRLTALESDVDALQATSWVKYVNGSDYASVTAASTGLADGGLIFAITEIQ